jgi:Chalcone isomerase-like
MRLSFRDTNIAIKNIAACALFITASASFVLANTSATPVELAQALSNPRNSGQARLVVFGFNIYDAKLWVSDGFLPTNYAKQSFALELRYLRSFNGQSIAERSLKEMRKLGQVSDEKAAEWLAQMKQTFPDIKKGDQLIGIHRSDGSAIFLMNGKAIGEVRDAEFTRLFFGIWLSPRTSEPKMRLELIGASSEVKR